MPDNKPPVPSYEDLHDMFGDDLMSFMSNMVSSPGEQASVQVPMKPFHRNVPPNLIYGSDPTQGHWVADWAPIVAPGKAPWQSGIAQIDQSGTKTQT